MNASTSQEDKSSGPYYLLLTFWGDRFREFACRLTFPSLLASHNVPALRGKRAKFLIATTTEDWHQLEKEAVFRTLRENIDVEFLPNEEANPPLHKYVRMSRGHALLAERCFRDKAIAININPDSIYPDGSITEAVRLCENGKDVVLCAAVRFDMEGVEQELAERGFLAKVPHLTLPVRDAVTIGLHNLHSETQASSWTARNFGRLNAAHAREHFLTCCYWEVPSEDGVIIITHNWSPFLVNYGVLGSHNTSALDGRALDGTYIFENFPQYTDSIHIIRDSDTLFLLGLTPREEMRPPDDRRWWKELTPLREWTRGYILNRTVFDPGIDDHRRRMYRVQVRWHARDFNQYWNPVERVAQRTIDKYVTHDLDKQGVRLGEIGRFLALKLLRPLIFWRIRF